MNKNNIKYVEHSIANNFGDVIELNRNLLKYPNLHEQVLEHELDHSDEKGFTKYDLNHDLKASKINQWELMKFMFLHPKAFIQLLPIYYTKERGWVYDINLSLIYAFLIVIIVVGIMIGLAL